MTQPWLAELSVCVITDSSHNFWKVSVFNDPLVLRERHSTYWKDSLNSSKCTWRQWFPSLPWALSATSTEAYLTMVWKWATSASAPGAPSPHTQHHPHQQQLKHLRVTLQHGKHCSLPLTHHTFTLPRELCISIPGKLKGWQIWWCLP